MGRCIDFYLIGELVDSHGNVHYEDLKHLPTADVVEVVRCGFCKWLKPDGKCKVFADYQIIPSASDYCSYGQRREDEC